jgi:lysophospholipase L1-like esterase
MRAFCAANGIPFLALSPDMLRFNESTGKPLHGFGGRGHGHFNLDGHRVAADSIAGRLSTLLP